MNVSLRVRPLIVSVLPLPNTGSFHGLPNATKSGCPISRLAAECPTAASRHLVRAFTSPTGKAIVWS